MIFSDLPEEIIELQVDSENAKITCNDNDSNSSFKENCDPMSLSSIHQYFINQDRFVSVKKYQKKKIKLVVTAQKNFCI